MGSGSGNCYAMKSTPFFFSRRSFAMESRPSMSSLVALESACLYLTMSWLYLLMWAIMTLILSPLKPAQSSESKCVLFN